MSIVRSSVDTATAIPIKYLQRNADNPSLMTAELMNKLCEHALGNYRG